MKLYKFNVQLIIIFILLFSCNSTPSKSLKQENKLNTNDTIVSLHNNNNENLDTTDLSNASYFIIIVDTSIDYFNLHKKMFDLNKKINVNIDTMGRFFNKSKNLISLPDNDKDEMYAGEYFPRRFPSENLSLEYLKFYFTNSGNETLALVAGIYELEKDAEIALKSIKKVENKSFLIESNIYRGCLH